MGDLLRAPCCRPTPTLTMNGTALLPYHRWASKADTLCICNLAGKPLFHIGPQRRVACQLARPRARCCAVSMPLGRNGPVIQIAATRGCVAPYFTRNRTWRTTEFARDGADARATRELDRYLFTLGKAQKSPSQCRRRRRQMCWCHAPRTPKPARTQRQRNTGIGGSFLTCAPLGNRLPETAMIFTPPCRWSPRRPQSSSGASFGRALTCHYHNLQFLGVATTG